MDLIAKHPLRLFAAVFLFASISYAQAPSAPQAQGGGITREQADQILHELREIRQLLANGATASRPAQPAQAAQDGKIDISGLPMLGRADAPLTIVEFSDYQCPYCRAFHTTTFQELKKDWIDTGKARFVSWDMPLEMHSNAAKASQAARCAGEQNRFWEFRSLLIANAAKLASEDILGYAQQVPQLDLERFKTCTQSGRYSEEIRKSVTEGHNQGITGTPTFLIAKTKGDLVDGDIFIGAQTYTAFENELKKQLAK